MARVIMEIEDKLLNGASEILEDIGLDVNAGMKMFLTRVVKEQSITFLLDRKTKQPTMQGDPPTEKTLEVEDEKGEETEKTLTKGLAVRLFRGCGYEIGKNVTYASKNRNSYNYWANPSFDLLKKDWHLILNDWQNRRLYLFFIPANSLKRSDMVARADKDVIDLQISPKDMTFRDIRSRQSFGKFFQGKITYDI